MLNVPLVTHTAMKLFHLAYLESRRNSWATKSTHNAKDLASSLDPLIEQARVSIPNRIVLAP
jgi:hypothetical protein